MTHDAQFSGQPSHVTAIPCMQPLVHTYRLIGPFYPLMPRLKDLHLILIGKIVSWIDYLMSFTYISSNVQSLIAILFNLDDVAKKSI